MDYRFTFEITTNCNYYCDYCIVAKQEEYSDINIINNVVKFFEYIYNYILKDNDTITIQLMGGEPTLHPLFEYFINRINTLTYIKLIIISNFSSDLKLYDRICNNNRLEDFEFYLSYHENHILLDDYLDKFDYLINKYPNIIFSPQCMLDKGRKTTKDIINIFDKYINHKNFILSIFPIINYDTYNSTNVVNILDNNSIVSSNLNIIADKNTINKYYNRNLNCSIENGYIKSNGHLCLCFSYKNKVLLDLNSNKIDKKFNIIKNMKFKCNNVQCYFKTNWESNKNIK